VSIATGAIEVLALDSSGRHPLLASITSSRARNLASKIPSNFESALAFFTRISIVPSKKEDCANLCTRTTIPFTFPESQFIGKLTPENLSIMHFSEIIIHG